MDFYGDGWDSMDRPGNVGPVHLRTVDVSGRVDFTDLPFKHAVKLSSLRLTPISSMTSRTGVVSIATVSFTVANLPVTSMPWPDTSKWGWNFVKDMRLVITCGRKGMSELFTHCLSSSHPIIDNSF